MTTSARFSQLSREALRGGSGQVRFSGLAREALRGGNGEVRFSGLVREVLMNPTPLVSTNHGQILLAAL